MSVYEGKLSGDEKNNKTHSLTGVGENVVMSMVDILETPTAHKIYIDNFFTSHKLLACLSSKGIRCTGTARYNRMGLKTDKTNLKNDNDIKKEERGFYDYRFDKNNKILAVIWKDNNAVKMLSNHETIEPLVSVKRYSKTQKKHIDILQPNLVSSYNKYMGGVDKLDWHIQKYRIKIRGKKWYFPLFTNALAVTVYNAFVLYNFSHSKIPFLDFKRMIAREYLQKSSYSDSRNAGRPSNSIHRNRFPSNRSGPGHIIERILEGKQRRCAVCKKNARKQCKLCDVGIHIPCFPIYHNSL